MESFRFHSWAWLVLLPVVAALCIWLYGKRNKPEALLFSSTEGLAGAPVSPWIYVRRLLPWLEWIGLSLLVIAVARPQLGKSETRISGQGIAIELILDISGSMEAIDFVLGEKEVNRITAVKHVVQEFVRGSRELKLAGRKNDQLGLVAFGGFADSRSPLTLDHDALLDMVEALQIPRPVRDSRGRVMNEEGLQEELATAIGDGLALGIDKLKNSKAKSKVAVLLTDGDNNAGVVDPREAAQMAKQLGVKVYTIGIGQSGVVPLPQYDELGTTIIVPARLNVDEALLQEIAEETGGAYFHASDMEGLAEVYGQIDALEKSELEETQYAQYTELFRWFLVPGLALLGVVHGLLHTRFRWLS